MTFTCPCGQVFKRTAYYYETTWRDICNVHRELCDGAASTIADPDASGSRPVRQAAGATSTPASAANQLGRNRTESGTDLASRVRGGFILFVACPTIWVAAGVATVRGWL